MYKFIRKNQKHFMAVFAVFLMVAFLMTMGPQSGCGGSGAEFVVGRVGDEEITQAQIRQAEDEWNFLSTRIAVQRRGEFGQIDWAPLSSILNMSAEAYQQMRRRPEMYYLMLLEARQMGASASMNDVEQLLSSPLVAILPGDDTRIPFADVKDERLRRAVQYHVGNLLTVMNAYQRAVNAVKISEPMIQHELAQQQQIKTQVVDFPVKDYEDKVPEPTPEQLEAHFKQFADFESDVRPSESNPFGFGYKYPNRVKLQYVAVPREQVRGVVRRSQSAYDWKVAAARYYNQNQDEFPASQPATTQESFSLGPTERKGPTTQPFDDALAEKIISRLVDEQSEPLQRRIMMDVTNRLKADFDAFQQQAGATTAPAFSNFEYLQSIAADIEKRHGVTLKLASIADGFKTAEDLRRLEGIGQINQFPDYATMAVEPFVPAEVRNNPAILSLYEPSRTLTEPVSGDSYVFRVTAADPSHAPASYEEVKQQVTDDWKRLQAFELAKADAQKLLERAKEPGLAAVAGDRLVTTSAYSRMDPTPIENYTLSSQGQPTFVQQTFKLLTPLASQEKTRPIAVVTIPSDGKVAVAELVYVAPSPFAGMFAMNESALAAAIAQSYAQEMSQQWFDYDSLVQRLGYVDETGQAPTTQTASAQ